MTILIKSALVSKLFRFSYRGPGYGCRTHSPPDHKGLLRKIEPKEYKKLKQRKLMK